MVEKRDVQLIIRANDLTSQPLRAIVTAVDQLNAALGRQTAAAAQGKASLGELKGTLDQLRAAGQALAQQQGMIDLFQRLTKTLETAQTKAAAARAAFDTLKQGLSGAAEVSERQASRLERLGRAADRSEASVVKAAAAVEKQRAALATAGIDTQNLAAAQGTLVSTAERVSASIKTASDAMGAFSENARRAKAAADLTGFRGLADQAAAATRGAGGLPVTGRGAGAASTAQGLQAIVDPAAAARTTLAGVEGEIRSLSTAATTAGGTLQQYAATLQGLRQASQAVLAQGTLVDAFQRQTAAVRTARAEFETARTTFNQVAAAVRGATEPNDELAASLRRAQGALQSTGAALTTQVSRARDARTALDQAGISSRRLVSEQQRLQAAAAQTAEAMRKAGTQIANLTGPQGYKGPPTLFGLRPYELQNLGYQINDVFTQIGSGTSVMQTLSQQGGQILQLFPGAFQAIARFLPVIAAVGSAAVVSLSAVNRLLETQAALREFSGILTATSDGARYQAGALVEAQRAAQAYGATFADAGRAIREFVQNDVNPARITQFARASQDFVDIYGGKLPDAAKLVAEAFTRDSEAVAKLNQEYEFLSPAVARNIQQLFEEGRAEEARTLAFEAFAKKMSEGAAQARGPWTDATRAFSAAWGSMLDQLANSAVVVGAVNAMTKAVENATKAFKGLTAEQQIAASTTRIAELQGQIAEIERNRAAFRAPGARPAGAPDAAEARIQALRKAIDDEYAATRRLTDAQAQQAQTQGQQTAATVTGTGALDKQTAATNRQLVAGDRFLEQQAREILQRKAVKDLTQQEIAERIRLAGVEAALAATKAGSDQGSIQTARLRAEAEERRKINAELAKQGASAFNALRAQEESLMSALLQMEKKITTGSQAELDERVKQYDEALAKILRMIEDAQRKGVKTVIGVPIEEFTARAVRATDNGKLLESMRASEQRVNEIIRERNDLVAANNALVEAGAMSTGQAAAENEAIYARTAVGIQEAADKWKEFARQAQEAGLITETAMAAVAAKVQLIGVQVRYVNPELKQLAEDIKGAFVSNITSFFDQAAQALGKFATGTQNLKQTFAGLAQATAMFFAGLLKDIAAAILKMVLLRAVSSFMGGLGGGGEGGLLSSLLGAAVKHDGGMIGSGSGVSRFVPAIAFANAPRYHSGYAGIGMRSDERAAILQTGEEVLNRDDPRNMKNWGRGGSGKQDISIRNVLVTDPNLVTDALQTPGGERAILSVIRANAGTVRSMVR